MITQHSSQLLKDCDSSTAFYALQLVQMWCAGYSMLSIRNKKRCRSPLLTRLAICSGKHRDTDSRERCTPSALRYCTMEWPHSYSAVQTHGYGKRQGR